MVLDTIFGGSYEDCIYAKITEKLEKIYRNNKARSTRKLGTGRNTFEVYVTNNSTIYKIHEEMAHIRTELGFVLKPVSGGS